MNFQEIILNLKKFWAKEGCAIIEPYDLEKGAGTFNPATFFGAVDPKPSRSAYVEPSRRPTDGRYGENPNRLARYYQFQVILKPSPDNIQELYLRSLKSIGLELKRHDLRWIEDDWESPTLGASGVGWEIWLDGMEVTQFTYFQQMAGIQLFPICVEITYGLERLAMYAQKKRNVFDIQYSDRVTYGDLHLASERQFSRYHFEESDPAILSRNFNECESEGKRLSAIGCVLPAYDMVVKCSHLFNLLEARGAISVTERTHYIGRVRSLAKKVIHGYLEMIQSGSEARSEKSAAEEPLQELNLP